MDIVLVILRPVLGIGLLLLFCYSLSERKDKIRWSLVAYGVVLQILLAVLILKLPFAHEAIRSVSQLFNALVGFSNESAAFVFGTLASDSRGTYGFAFTVLPTIIFFSAFSAILYYL
ncbi:MAG: Na+ dependent nucleoside transporter, partial [Verrucomicrobia bacterium TMED71]